MNIVEIELNCRFISKKNQQNSTLIGFNVYVPYHQYLYMYIMAQSPHFVDLENVSCGWYGIVVVFWISVILVETFVRHISQG